MIRNRVKESGVITIDLMDFCNNKSKKSIDLIHWLENGLIIKEASFKNRLKSIDINVFKGALVNIFCSSDAIIPTWAYLFLQTKIQTVAKDVFFGNNSEFELYLFQSLRYSCFFGSKFFYH